MIPSQSKEPERLVLKVDFNDLTIQIITEDEDNKSFCVLCEHKDKCNNKCLIYCG